MMDFKAKKECLAEMGDEILLADGFEEALIGYCQIFSRTIALYDEAKCIGILVKRDGMSEEDAREYFSFNVTGAYVGENTPAFATLFEPAWPTPERHPRIKARLAAKRKSKRPEKKGARPPTQRPGPGERGKQT
jgi:hypothetical protein